MKKILIFFFVLIGFSATAQNFTFECFCQSTMTGDSCDICPGTSISSRSFSGLLIYRNGVKYKWIDEPYMVRLRPNENVEFLEQGPNADKVTIALYQTPYTTIAGFLDSTFCQCGDFRALWYASDSTSIGPIYPGDTLAITGWGATTVTYDTTLKKYVIYTPVSGGTGTVTNFSFTDANGFDGTVTNPTTTPNLTLATTITGIIYGASGALNAVTVGAGLNFSAPTLTAVDQSATNEAQTLSVSGTSTGIISLNTISGVGGGTATIAGAGINTVSQLSGTITITGTEVDGALANEGLLGVGAGGASSSVITSNTAGATGVTVNASTGLSISETTSSNGGQITLTNTSPLGSGTENYFPKWNTGGASLTGTSLLYDNGSSVILGGTTANGRFNVRESSGKHVFLGEGEVKMQGPAIAHWSMRANEGGTAGLYFINTSGGDNIGQAGTTRFHIKDTEVACTNNFKLGSYSGSAAVSITGRDASNFLTSVTIGSGLSLSGGTLSATGGSSWLLGGNTVGSLQTIGTNDNFDLPFETNGTIRGRFSTTGDFLVNSTTTGNKLNVEGLGASGVCARFNGGTLASFNTNVLIGGNATTTVYGIDENMTVSGASNNLINRFRNGSTGSVLNQISVSSTAGGDPMQQFNVETATTWTQGIDNSDSDRFKIAKTSALGVSTSDDVFVIDPTDGRASIGGAALQTEVNLVVAGSGGIMPPSGAGGTRPAVTQPIIRNNTDFNGLEFKNSNTQWHRITGTSQPSFIAGTGAGTSPTITTVGTDRGFRLNLTTGTAPAANGDIVTITYGQPFQIQPYIATSPYNAQAATDYSKYYVVSIGGGASGPGGFTLRANGTLAASTDYVISFVVQQ